MVCDLHFDINCHKMVSTENKYSNMKSNDISDIKWPNVMWHQNDNIRSIVIYLNQIFGKVIWITLNPFFQIDIWRYKSIYCDKFVIKNDIMWYKVIKSHHIRQLNFISDDMTDNVSSANFDRTFVLSCGHFMTFDVTIQITYQYWSKYKNLL